MMPLALKTLNEGGAFRSLFCYRSKVLVIADFDSVTFFSDLFPLSDSF